MHYLLLLKSEKICDIRIFARNWEKLDLLSSKYDNMLIGGFNAEQTETAIYDFSTLHET